VDEFDQKNRGEEFGQDLGKIMEACSENDFGTWLQTYHSLLWYRSGFNTAIKCDHINNNLVESFNNKVKSLKDLHVYEMVDQIRIMILRLWEFRRRICDVPNLPAVVPQVVNMSRNLAYLTVEKSSLICGVLKLEIPKLEGVMLLTLKCMNVV
jgi:hypothetical protein